MRTRNEWVTVGRSKGGRPKQSHEYDKLDRETTVDSIRAGFDQSTALWKGSPSRRALVELLGGNLFSSDFGIRKAVCLATGSFSRDNLQNRRRSMLQFAVFIDILRHLERLAKVKIDVLAQDPMYTIVDVDFLSTLKVQVIGPHSSDSKPLPCDLQEVKPHLGQTTFVYEPYMNTSLDDMELLCSGDVGLYIGSSWRKETFMTDASGVRVFHTRLSTLVRSFHADRRAQQFPLFSAFPGAFDGLVIYWKEPTAASVRES